MCLSKDTGDWMDLKKDPSIFDPQETHFRPKDTQRLTVKDGKKISMQIETKKAGVPILKTEVCYKDKGGHHIMAKGFII